MVDKSVPPATVAQLQKTIAAASGITPARGDTISASQFTVAKAPVAKTGPVPTTLLGPRLGRLPPEVIEQVGDALRFSLGI